jgi:hypothetical protein
MVGDAQHQTVARLQHRSQKDYPCDQCVTEDERMSYFPIIHPLDIIGICQIPIEIEQFPSEFSHIVTSEFSTSDHFI